MERWAALLIRTGPDREKKNMVWNMAGSFCYAFASMVLSFLVMRLAGEEQGGVFSFGFSTVGQQMFLLAYFGIRPFQITDGKREYRFGDYLYHRRLTCGAALVLGAVWVFLSGYRTEKAAVIMLLVVYKVIDGFADVYESEFQRMGRLYLTGKSNTFRTMLSVGVFLVFLVVGKNLTAACAAAAAAQLAGVCLFDLVVLRQLDGVDYSRGQDTARALTAATLLLFLSVFLDFYIFSASKYAIDAHMNDAASGYFNVIFMPTSVINLAADRGADGAGCGRCRRTGTPGAGDSGVGAWSGVCREADFVSWCLCLDRSGRRMLCAPESLLLCPGHHAQAEDHLRDLSGAGRCRGSAGALYGGAPWYPGGGWGVPDPDGRYGGRLCGSGLVPVLERGDTI